MYAVEFRTNLTLYFYLYKINMQKENFTINWNFDQESLMKHRNCDLNLEKLSFVVKSKFWSKIPILVKNKNFGQKFRSKIEILVKN